ncbi:mannose-1-phosphate guanylyltransferase [Faecalibacter rhinopitheci]|uniref:Mannose-1-phosphate guanylyltransferase n=1 Tax=Faecalibacter rhinopitheci TaxID=2779678 RepID=A0A8J7FS09_9FLAO|nr:sugar phosphate nucleotidyltransferase [Faecalibacter rhinopitheci]MBF0597583.1 mannose-1-phosphate guanylyltransferase [Faecalibacter rhinopitheci]MBQ0148627.1 mannose-1-phosphate guanylyltransferase [Candidatus Onthonaster equi]
MTQQNNYAVILASGTGVRLWPMSTVKKPKQFLDVLGIGKTLIQITYNRLKKVVPAENIFIITTEEYIHLVKEQIPTIIDSKIILEPRIMNTAACNLLAAMHIHQLNPLAKLIVAPSDHLIYDVHNFIDCINLAFDYADSDHLISIGVEPNRPDTNLSYVQIIENESPIKKVKTFVDKPDEDFAKTFIQSGDFFWNTGILIWSTKAILEAFESYRPSMIDTLKKYFEQPLRNPQVLKPIYTTLDVISINNAILEKAKNVYVIPSEIGWNDMGTWKSIHDHTPTDEDGNNIKCKYFVGYNTTNTFIHTTQEKAIIVNGLKDFVVIDSVNGLLICPKDNVKEIRSYVSNLRLSKGEKYC